MRKIFQTKQAANEIVIKAHIKEINGKTIVISSDSDGYPGAFWVDVPGDVADLSVFSGGDAVVVHMIDKSSEQNGMKVFQAYRISAHEEQDEPTEHYEVLLTGAPVISLTDALSSTMNQLELQSGGYEWSYKDDGQIVSLAACGAGPLNQEETDSIQVLTIPDYNETEKVIYSMNAVIPPDEAVLKEWDINDMGNNEAEPKRTVNYFCRPFFLELKKNAVYEVTALWKESNIDINGFHGNASYVVKTQ